MKTKCQEEPHEVSRYIRIPAGDVHLMADLQVPQLATSVVIFAYEFGGSRNHPRPRHVARVMREYGLATLLCDLLTDEEEIKEGGGGINRHNVALLAERVIAVTKWVAKEPELKKMKLAYFGASSGGGAALIAAATLPKKVKAVVSRGGRGDLAAKCWTKV